MDMSCLWLRREGGSWRGLDRPRALSEPKQLLHMVESIREHQDRGQPHNMAEFPAGRRPWALGEVGHPLHTYRSWVFPVKGLRRWWRRAPEQRPGSSGKAGSVEAGPVGRGQHRESLWSRSQLSHLLHSCWLVGVWALTLSLQCLGSAEAPWMGWCWCGSWAVSRRLWLHWPEESTSSRIHQ